VFKLFWMYVASVLSECYKSRSDIAHVAMRVRSAGPAWAREMQARAGRADPSVGNVSAAWASIQTSGCSHC
jgi:hypothetical protein